jgi:hypothetical protein
MNDTFFWLTLWVALWATLFMVLAWIADRLHK